MNDVCLFKGNHDNCMTSHLQRSNPRVFFLDPDPGEKGVDSEVKDVVGDELLTLKGCWRV